MQFLHKPSGKVYTHLTAKTIAYLAIEGVQVHASTKEWARINKRARKMGLVIADEHVSIDEVTQMAIDILIQETDLDIQYEVEELLEEFYVLGMLDDSDPDDEEDE